MSGRPSIPAKEIAGDFDPVFINFARRVISVPRSVIKARLDAEKEAKRTSKASASRVSGASSNKYILAARWRLTAAQIGLTILSYAA